MPPRRIALPLARRLALTRQRLAGPRPAPDRAGILATIRDLGCLQLDPTSVVARTHLLVLWSRLGAFDPADLEALRRDRLLFEYWAHQASLVLAEDYQIHQLTMRTFAAGDRPWHRRVQEWLAANEPLRRSILAELRERGPTLARDLTDATVVPWRSTGWTNQRNLARMLDLLSVKGEVLVAGRAGGQRLWDLAERCLPADLPTEELPEREIVRRATQRSLRALGVARPVHVRRYFTRDTYPGLGEVLAELAGTGQIVPVTVDGGGTPLRGDWFVHADDLPLLDRLEAGDWRPRTTLLSPFDNLICNRERTAELFGFDFKLEIYVPKVKRRHGYFVMPLLHGDRLVARADLAVDRADGVLVVHALHVEPGVRASRETAAALTDALHDLAGFAGATTVRYGALPADWRPLLA
jgi:uncharacterized protein YcaQ